MINNKLNPYFITGFSDAESCFNVTVSPRISGSYQVSLRFKIQLHHQDLDLLEKIKTSFNSIGSLNVKNYKTYINPKATFSVRKFDDIMNVIIPHFDKYPLLTQKQADFLLFKEIALLMKNKEHLTPEGIAKIVAIKASMNLGLSDKLSLAFPVKPFPRPVIQTLTIPDFNWITGFAEGDSSFFINLYKVKDTKTKFSVKLMFRLAQHTRDLELLKLIRKNLNCGTIQLDNRTIRSNNMVNYTVTEFYDIYSIIMPFFKQYPLKGIKSLNFEDFYKVAEIMHKSEHLSLEGINKIIEIKKNMNSNRTL